VWSEDLAVASEISIGSQFVEATFGAEKRTRLRWCRAANRMFSELTRVNNYLTRVNKRATLLSKMAHAGGLLRSPDDDRRCDTKRRLALHVSKVLNGSPGLEHNAPARARRVPEAALRHQPPRQHR